ncbi:UdgX family uracil-DNA binding protein [Nakamurella flava]|uniref:Type-4 uracil-DNA glycosylase n=1 Tax=Nakamurella flava TaxID=2576308 RepID=A0A4U6QJX2_9ACTN|nr:UdgX family uracil-DNA binding protein [Nakamurella flava]TKV60743.1 UdgX family uracil-DNA binding protein [Nakamurella flava]
MTTPASARPFVPDTTDLTQLAEAARGCQGCELFRDATQTVFGAGGAGARMMLIGEQPGDAEDRAGEPFIGPAGRLLDEVLTEAGIDRSTAYVTNAVKHFRWKSTDTGRRRIHQSPTRGQITACSPWLVAELAAVDPRVVVALGASAGKALFGASFTISAHRGSPLTWPPESGPFAADLAPRRALATIHPSAVLRARDAHEREAARDGLVADLRQAAGLME